MISTQDLLSLGGGLLRKRRVSYDKRVIHPTRDWLIGLLFFFTIIIAGGCYSAYQFVTYRNITVHETVVSETIVKYNSVLVTRMLEQYALRKANYDGVLRVAASMPVEDVSASTTEEVEEGTEAPLESASSTEEVVREEVE